MDIQKLAENVGTVLSRVEGSLEKGKHNIKAIYVTTTMGKSVKVA
jgi:large subunit ribosomal protein L1